MVHGNTCAVIEKNWSLNCPTTPYFLKQNASNFIMQKNNFIKKIPSHSCAKIEYFPSKLEKHWYANIDTIAGHEPHGCWNCGCAHIRASEKLIQQWLKVSSNREKLLTQDVWSRDVFSYHKVSNLCRSGNRKRHAFKIPIEPLIGFLRHPLDFCFGHDKYERRGAFRLNKDYLIQRHAHEIVMHSKSFLFDLGASTYSAGAGGASQSWFIEQFMKRGIYFDRIFAWEATQMPDVEIFENVPKNVLNNLTYFNVPADPAFGAKHNPLRILAELVHEDDFVVFKMDIDTSSVEMPLIKQIMDDAAMHSRIDELYFEHHVSRSPMHWRGWGDTVGNESLPDSYLLFSKLRSLGIRAHSWV